MTGARRAILERVRRAQRTGRIPVMDVADVEADDRRRQRSTMGDDECLARFLTELTALGVEHFVEPSVSAVRDRVASIVEGHAVFAWNADRLPYDVGNLLSGSVTGSSTRDAQAAAQIGVTGCDAAIAETGSLVLLSGEGQPRAASLLPPVHLAIVRRADLRFSMGEFFKERARDIAGAACCTFVTGPSRTADIEMTLTLGVHGPGNVIVVVGPECRR